MHGPIEHWTRILDEHLVCCVRYRVSCCEQSARAPLFRALRSGHDSGTPRAGISCGTEDGATRWPSAAPETSLWRAAGESFTPTHPERNFP